jgi:transposase-like protein
LTLTAEIYYFKSIDEIYYRNQGDFMSRKKPRLSPERKFKAVCEVIAGKQTCSEVARKYHISVSHLWNLHARSEAAIQAVVGWDTQENPPLPEDEARSPLEFRDNRNMVRIAQAFREITEKMQVIARELS